jgi:folate-dependent phosphoribosylglycinamide formyltransferase PurN
MGDSDKLRIILLTHGGAERVLARLVALDCANVVGLFIETDTSPQRRRRSLRERLERSIRYEGLAATCAKPLRHLAARFRRTAASMESRDPHADLCALAGQHGVAVHFVTDYHAPAAIALMREARPDLGVVYGTNILKESVFAVPRLGSINLHQALVPFYRGGPVLFWELFNGEHEAGVTVHTVADKVDAGHVIIQESLPLSYDFETYGLDYASFIEGFRAQKMAEVSARLVADAVRMFADGTARPQPQDLSLGRRYRLPTKREKDELRRRLRARRKAAAMAHGAANAATIRRHE